jgi:hypothetical protein
MKRSTLCQSFQVFITVGFIVAITAFAAFPAQPAIPKSGDNLNAFVPARWKIMEQAKGDLNKDGIPDAVLVLKNSEEEKDGVDTTDMKRLLVIVLGTPAGGYNLSTISEEAILCKDCGGIFGDPFAGIKIARGVIVIEHYGGSNQRWGYTHRWRYQDGDWCLIGLTSRADDLGAGTSEVTDINLVTGDSVVEKAGASGKAKSVRSKVPVKAIQKLSAFTFQY